MRPAIILPAWDDITFCGSAVYLEAGGEPFVGKLGVAYVICRRDDANPNDPGLDDVLLKPWQFSAFNTEHAPRARLQNVMIARPPSLAWWDSMKAAAAAIFELLPDPTGGATHYLNEAVTRQIRKDGTLPPWFDEAKVTARIARHTFLKL